MIEFIIISVKYTWFFAFPEWFMIHEGRGKLPVELFELNIITFRIVFDLA